MKFKKDPTISDSAFISIQELFKLRVKMYKVEEILKQKGIDPDRLIEILDKVE